MHGLGRSLKDDAHPGPLSLQPLPGHSCSSEPLTTQPSTQEAQRVAQGQPRRKNSLITADLGGSGRFPGERNKSLLCVEYEPKEMVKKAMSRSRSQNEVFSC